MPVRTNSTIRNRLAFCAALVQCLGLLAYPGMLQAQQQAAQIYSCVDAQGRTLTADKPIRACIDREQRILDSATGHERAVLPPSYTAEERAEIHRNEQASLELQRQKRDQRQRERILLMRYPDQAAHDRARVTAKEQIEAVIAGALLRLDELKDAGTKLEQELEFYKGDLKKAPRILQRQIEANQQDILDQEKFIQGQQGEKLRIDNLYDEELEALRKLWDNRNPD